MKIAKVRQTCFGCPSQWDAWTEDGDYLYLRYRWGVISVQKEVPGYSDMQYVARFRHGDDMDGVISLEEFCSLAGLQLSDRVEYLQQE